MRRAGWRQAAGVLAGASLLVSTLGIAASAFAFSGNPDYYDISHLTTLAQRAANTLYEQGIMNGTAPGKFSPYGLVTRAQAVKFVVNALKLPLSSGAAQTYTDVTVRSQYYPYIEAAAKAGILAGVAPASGDFDPSDMMTRVDFAVLATNALGDGSLAESLASNRTKYDYLKDLGTVPAADLGDVNAMIEVGIVPPYNSTRFAPFSQMNRDEFAVAIMRLYNVLSSRNLASVTLTAATPTVAVGQTDQLRTVATSKTGSQLSASELSAYTVSYSVTGTNSSSATVSPNGAFAATASGTYTVQVAISGNGLSASVTATTQIQVYGSPTALKVLPKSPSVVADQQATDSVLVDVLDNAGNIAANYNGPVTLTDTNNGTEILGSGGTAQAGAVTVTAADGIAVFTVQSYGNTGGLSDTLTATASYDGQSLSKGTATVSTVAQSATSVSVQAASNDLRANEAANTDAISAIVNDQAGYPMLTGAYTIDFSVSGPADFSGSSQTASGLFAANDTTNPNPAQVELESEMGDTGTVTVTASTTGLQPGTVRVESVIAGAPASLKVSTANASVAAGASDTITVALEDANGNETTTTSALPITATITKAGATVGTLSGTIPAGGGSATLAFSETAVGAYTVSVSATGLPTQDVTIDVSSGQAAGLSLTPAGPVAGAPVELPQGSATVQVTAQLVDADGNPVSLSGTPVTFAASGGSGSYTVNGAATSATVDTGANGTVQASFDFGTSTGTWTVTGTANVGSATQTFAIVPYTASSVDVHLNQSGTVNSGQTVSGTITAEQPNGTADDNADYLQVAVTPAAGLSALSFTDPANAGATVTPVSSQGGVYLVKTSDGSIDFSSTAAQAGQVTVEATDLSTASAVHGSASVSIYASGVPSAAAAFNSAGGNLATTPLSVTADDAVPMAIKLTDAFGNAVSSDVPVTVVLSDWNGTSAGGGGFRGSAGGADLPNNELTVPAGSAGVTVYYINATAGSYTIDASTPGLMTGVSSKAGSTGQGTIDLDFAGLPNGGSITADSVSADWTVVVNGQTLPSSDYTVAGSGDEIGFTLSAGYVSGQSFAIAPTGVNDSQTNAGIAVSIPATAFDGQSLS